MEALKHVETLVSAKLSVLKTVFTLIQLEARLAGLSVFPLILNLCMLFVVLLTFWLMTSLLIGYGILFVSQNIFLSLVLVFLFNLTLLLGLVKYLVFNIKNMSFAKTRAYFFQDKSTNDEPFEKTSAGANSQDK